MPFWSFSSRAAFLRSFEVPIFALVFVIIFLKFPTKEKVLIFSLLLTFLAIGVSSSSSLSFGSCCSVMVWLVVSSSSPSNFSSFASFFSSRASSRWISLAIWLRSTCASRFSLNEKKIGFRIFDELYIFK